MNEALTELQGIKTRYQTFIRENFEFAAADCGSCKTFGVCCTDAHFVNVHITRLEAAAISAAIENDGRLSDIEKAAVYERARDAVEKYNLSETGDTFAQTFACPLFVPERGCLVHDKAAKPLPCISHACYERPEDLPPACLQDAATKRVERLNEEVYGEDWRWLPLPIQLYKLMRLNCNERRKSTSA